MLVCWWWWSDWSFARFIAPVVQLSPLTTSIILCFNKHRLTQVHLEMAVKTERETHICDVTSTGIFQHNRFLLLPLNARLPSLITCLWLITVLYSLCLVFFCLYSWYSLKQTKHKTRDNIPHTTFKEISPGFSPTSWPSQHSRTFQRSVRLVPPMTLSHR